MTTKKATTDRKPDAKILPAPAPDNGSAGTLTATGEVLEYRPELGEHAAKEGEPQAQATPETSSSTDSGSSSSDGGSSGGE